MNTKDPNDSKYRYSPAKYLRRQNIIYYVILSPRIYLSIVLNVLQRLLQHKNQNQIFKYQTPGGGEALTQD